MNFQESVIYNILLYDKLFLTLSSVFRNRLKAIYAHTARDASQLSFEKVNCFFS